MSYRMTLVAAALLAALPLGAAHAQSAAELVAAGNAAYEARNAPESLRDYERALALEPRNYEALWRAARAGVELGEFNPDAEARAALYRTAEQRGRLAVEVKPDDAEGHFALALALGRAALTLGSRERIQYATGVRTQALECLKINAAHPGCMHVMGVWNAEIMRLNGLTRMVARSFLGGAVFSQASWQNAERYLVDAVKHDPRRVVHRLDLARVYADMGLKPQARSQYQAVLSGELIDYNDPRYKQQAAEELKTL